MPLAENAFFLWSHYAVRECCQFGMLTFVDCSDAGPCWAAIQAKGLNGGSLIQVDFIELDNLLLTLELILKLHLQLLLELNLLLLVQPQLLDFVDQLFRGNYVVIYILVMVRRVPWLHVMINVGTMYSGLCCLILVLLGSSE